MPVRSPGGSQRFRGRRTSFPPGEHGVAPNDANSQNVLNRLHKSDAEEWQRFHDRHRRDVLSISMTVLEDAAAALESVRAVFGEAFMKIDRVRDARDLEAWLKGLTVDIAFRARRLGPRAQKTVGVHSMLDCCVEFQRVEGRSVD